MKKWLKRVGIGLGALVVLIAGAFTAVYFWSESSLNETFAHQTREISVPTDAESIALGKHLVGIRGCDDCHGEHYEGRVVVDDPAAGVLAGSNLTRGKGSAVSEYTDSDWVRAIRHGVAPGGRKLVFMPSYEYQGISDADLGKMVAYLKSLPPADNEAPPIEIGPLFRVLMATGELKLTAADVIDHDNAGGDAPPVGATVEYGKYLSASCTGCHGEGFSGGKIPGVPPEWPLAANITPDKATGIGNWTEEQFVTALRTGVRPDGTRLKEPFMPVGVTRRMTDVEVAALWQYFQTVEAKPAYNR